MNTLYVHFVQSLAEVEMQNLNTEEVIVQEDVMVVLEEILGDILSDE